MPVNAILPSIVDNRGYAAIFIDFENIYYELKNSAPDREVTDYILTVVRQLTIKLDEAATCVPIIRKAYADFERIDTSPQGSLYLMGVETHNVMSTEHKNSADMRLCIDALEVLYTRPEIRTVVLVAGDRDYIPLVQHMRRQGRNVYVCSFRSNVSGDLLQNIESGHFIDAFELLNEEERRELELSRKLVESRQTGMVGRMPRKLGWQQITSDTQAPIIPTPTPAVAGPTSAPSSEQSAEPPRVRPGPIPMPSLNGMAAPAFNATTAPATNGTIGNGTPAANGVASGAASSTTAATAAATAAAAAKEKAIPTVPITDPMTKKALEIMLHHFGQHHEVWMSPLLWKLSNELPLLADFERKVLISNLESTGAIRIVKRQGTPYDYTVVLINYNHPTVRACVP